VRNFRSVSRLTRTRRSKIRSVSMRNLNERALKLSKVELLTESR
jgi:hypothetical protein